ncbi:MAG: right-handed parallel beta-helix repeat-containing protein [Planctomycetota bacterium]|nr:right-handed parallel beta-helix repeat-containing protein [Planctomycetota bacterium]MDA1212042.1 right-handed parallel beta-helix repeat-containing protein [Planctomycetota bacterium]
MKPLYIAAGLVFGFLIATSLQYRFQRVDAQEETATVSQPLKIDASDYPNLQAAFDAVPVSGGIVVIPPGNYEISEPLRVRTAETRIEGMGAATHIINRNEEGQPALVLEPANAELKETPRMWRVQVADLRISGNPKSGDGIYAHKIDEILLHAVSIDHHGGHGANLVSCYEDPRLSDNIITYCGKAGIHLDSCHDIVVNANHFEENQDGLRCVDSFNLCMNGNNLDDHLRHGVVIENTYGSVLSGNMIEECNGTAIILDRDCYGITISANVIAHELEGGVDLRDAWGCSVSANTFTLVHQFSVRVGSEGGRHAISGNAFCNSYVGGGDDKRPAEHKDLMGIDMGTGVVLTGAEDVAITGNTFTGLSKQAVNADQESDWILVANNLLSDCGRKLEPGETWLLIEASNSVEQSNLISAKP